VHVSIGHLAPPPMRARLLVHLRGVGLELGPGHQPFPVPDGAEVVLVDQWVPSDSRALFYELDESVEFPMPDVVADLDTDRLRAIADDSQDFVVASHILEHLAEPLGLLEDIHRVLRPGGALLALLPDRRRTFDRTRYGTGVDHVVAEHQVGITVVDDDHIVEFILHADHLMRRSEGIEPEPLTSELIEAHRLRSIHAHCWTEDEFIDLLLYGIRDMGLGFRLVDGFSARVGRGGWEFAFALQKVEPSVDDPTEELLDAWSALMARQASVDRWPVGVVLAHVIAAMPDLTPREIGAVSDALDVVLHRPDLQEAFASDALDVDAALQWAARVALGDIDDTSAARLKPHHAVLARWA
jgi:SAM-dependent methyltransferase